MEVWKLPNDLIRAFKDRAETLGIKCEQNENFENCYRFDNINTLVTTLETPEDLQLEELRDYVLSKVEEYIATALNLRKELSPAEANDIQLIYVCTPNETNSQLLRDLGYEIERDDRVCRKLLWQKGNYVKSVEEFLEKWKLYFEHLDEVILTSEYFLPINLLVSNITFFGSRIAFLFAKSPTNISSPLM